MARRRLTLLTLLATLAAAPAPAAAAAQDPLCLTAPDPLPLPARPPHDVRFGITPQAAGSAGVAQQQPAPEDGAKALAALDALRPPGRALVLRLNRLFESDGRSGIDRFAQLVDAYASAGFASEVQVRYHPAPAKDGDLDAWRAFVRDAVTTLGARRSVVAFTITNEANFPISPNTSDGTFKDPAGAIVSGITTARAALDAIGRRDVPVGFTVAWRYAPNADVSFWKRLGAAATPAFHAALGFVGVQLYPGLVWPPVPLPGRSAGRETADALAIVRTCHMPLARLGAGIPLWVTENGYATNLGRDTASQQRDLAATLQAVHDVSGTLNVTDYRYFNLRDNASAGTDLFDAVGLLRDDYTPKPAFATLRDAIAAFGAAPVTTTAAGAHGRHPRARRRPHRALSRASAGRSSRRSRARRPHGAPRLRPAARSAGR